MPKTFVDGREVKKWFVDGQKVKKAYLDGRLIYQSEYVLDITASNHNIALDWAWGLLPLDVRNDQTQAVRIIVRAGVQLITLNPTVRGVFDFYDGWGNREIVIENYGYIIGRGGAGGRESAVGAVGGRAIRNDSARLAVINRGVIAAGGGGGGGGGSALGASYGGGGGAPFAGGGWGSGESGHAASFDVPGAGKSWAGRVSGAGGGWGQGGAAGTGGGASAAGEATRGAINWIVLGDVRGARV